MFENYSQTYAATITTVAGVLGLYLNKFGWANSDVELVLSSLVCVGGLIWQFVHRFKKGGITPLGKKV